VASRGHQLADSFLCLANKNKEGIVTHYHLLTLVSTLKSTWGTVQLRGQGANAELLKG